MSAEDFDLNDAQSAHVQAVHDVLAKVYRREGVPDMAEVPTPLDALLKHEEGEPEDYYAAGIEVMRRFWAWIFEQGPDPAHVTQRVYTITNALWPELLLNMRGEEIAILFGQGRAAQSARTVLLNKKLAAAGFRHTSFRHQKSETSRRRMALAQVGNKNRSKKAGRKTA